MTQALKEHASYEEVIGRQPSGPSSRIIPRRTTARQDKGADVGQGLSHLDSQNPPGGE